MAMIALSIAESARTRSESVDDLTRNDWREWMGKHSMKPKMLTGRSTTRTLTSVYSGSQSYPLQSVFRLFSKVVRFTRRSRSGVG